MLFDLERVEVNEADVLVDGTDADDLPGTLVSAHSLGFDEKQKSYQFAPGLNLRFLNEPRTMGLRVRYRF